MLKPGPNPIEKIVSPTFVSCINSFNTNKMVGDDIFPNSSKILYDAFVSSSLNDNLLSNTIFGDGAAAVIITSNDFDKKGLSIKGFYSLLLNKGKDLMGWNITPVNFEMILDSKIPEMIGDEVNSIVANASKKLNISPQSISKWAIHPGGKKIIDVIKTKLHLTDLDTNASYKILDEFGNMSSPTILFVLNELMEEYKAGETIFSIGFGPGLSIETALFAYE